MLVADRDRGAGPAGKHVDAGVWAAQIIGRVDGDRM
jgi:hypothetical protein